MKELPVAKPSLGVAEADAAREAILSGWVTQGPRVKAFEDAFAAAVGSAHACAVSSCTAAMHLALAAVGVQAGDVVITVSHSFIATANAVRYCGAEPVFVDIDSSTLNMDPSDLERCLREDFERRDEGLWYRDVERLRMPHSPLRACGAPSGRLAAIQVVHQVGMPADMKSVLEIARRHGVPVVEDAACAVGSEIALDGRDWQRVGLPHGEIACFSFHPRKVITTGDGGMLTTNKPERDAAFRLLRQHGMGVSDMERHRSDEVVFEGYSITGYNYRMTDIQAAIGASQLDRLRSLIAERREIAGAYREALSGIRGIECPVEPAYARSNWQSFLVRLSAGQDQLQVMKGMKSRGINTRRGVMCAHLEPPYAQAWPRGSLPRSELAQVERIVLPLYPGMQREDIERVAAGLRAFGR
jgi:dTDP-4-amino-4,6-dideoxygalactose transaminase